MTLVGPSDSDREPESRMVTLTPSTLGTGIGDPNLQDSIPPG